MTSRWLLPVGVLALGAFAMGTDLFVLAGILPQIAAGLGAQQGAAGQVGTAFSLTYALAAPFLAALTGRFPRKPLMIVALVVFVVANLASAAAPTLPLLLAARVLAGLGAALYTPSASAAAAALGGPERRGRTLSFVLGGLAAGTVFGVPIGTAIGQQLSWQATLVFVAAVGTIAILGLAITLPELARPLLVPMRERLRLLVDRRVLVIVAVNALATAGGILVYTYIAPILGETAHITGLLLAGTLIAWGVGGCVGAFGSGWLIDRIGSERTIVLGITVLAVTLIALGFATRAASVAPIMVLFGASAWAVTTPNNHRLTALAPALPSVAISYNSSGIYLGQAVGAAVGGLLLDQHAGALTMCTIGAAIVLAALATNLAARPALISASRSAE